MAIIPPIYNDVRFYLGDVTQAAPYDVRLRRQSNHEVMTRMGTPVLIKHMFTIEDVEKNVAAESPTMDDIYKQSRYATDELSHGVGYVSVATQSGEWYDPKTGNVYVNNTQPDPSYLPAPKYRGYGPGYLTYAILPDRPEDTWKLSEQGALIRQQQALAQLPWYPTVGDNDLVIICDLDHTGRISQTFERYQLRMVSPITMRGNNPTPTFRSDWSGYREPGVVPDASGNRWWVGQQAEMVYLEPFASEQLYKVEVDR